MNTMNDTDLELWKQYKSGNKAAKWQLLNQFKGPIIRTARQQSNVRPYSVVEAELKDLTLKAFDTYDPKKGTKLLTHVMSNYKKLSRDNIANQHAIRVPENIHFKFKPITEANTYLTDALGREPTHQEVADYIKWPLPKVVDATSRLKKELIESKQTYDPKVYEPDTTEQGLFYAYNCLDNNGKYILEHSTGYGGANEYKDSKIQKDLKMTSYAYNKAKNNVIGVIQEAIGIANKDTGMIKNDFSIES